MAFTFAAFARQVHQLRSLRAVGPGWVFPSRVFSSDRPLAPGQVMSPAQLIAQLRARGYRPAAPPLQVPGTYAPQPGTLTA